MTTIAYKDGILAADSCITFIRDEHPLRRYSQCKLNVYNFLGARYKMAIATAGADGPCVDFERRAAELFGKMILDDRDDFFYSDKFLRVVKPKDGDEMEDPEDNPQGLAVIVDLEAGASRAFNIEIDYISSLDSPLAIGSDAAVAWGALHAGANAVQAVHAACVHGAYTALPIHFTSQQHNLVTQVFNGHID